MWRFISTLLALRTVQAVVPGTYCGTLSLPMGFGDNKVKITVTPDRSGMNMQLHGPHLDMHCVGDRISTAGATVGLDSPSCIGRWARDHDVRLRRIAHDPRAVTLDIWLSRKVGPIVVKRKLHLGLCHSTATVA